MWNQLKSPGDEDEAAVDIDEGEEESDEEDEKALVYQSDCRHHHHHAVHYGTPVFVAFELSPNHRTPKSQPQL